MKLMRTGPIGKENLNGTCFDNLRQTGLSALPEGDSAVRIGPCIGGVHHLVSYLSNFVTLMPEMSSQPAHHQV